MYESIATRPGTRDLLRTLSRQTGERIADLVARLAADELRRRERKERVA